MKKSKKVQIEFEEDHLYVLRNALEVYSRLRSGQISIALDQAFYDRNLSYEERKSIEGMVRCMVFKNEEIGNNSNSYYGVGCLQMKDGTTAYEIKKIIAQYLHYVNNNGYRNMMNVDGDGMISSISGIPLPKVLNFKPQKEFKIPKQHQSKIEFFHQTKNFQDMWKIVDKAFAKKPLPKGNKSRIVKNNDNSWYVVVEEPYTLL